GLGIRVGRASHDEFAYGGVLPPRRTAGDRRRRAACAQHLLGAPLPPASFPDPLLPPAGSGAPVVRAYASPEKRRQPRNPSTRDGAAAARTGTAYRNRPDAGGASFAAGDYRGPASRARR